MQEELEIVPKSLMAFTFPDKGHYIGMILKIQKQAQNIFCFVT